MEVVTEIIQNLGFPIACVVGLGVFAYNFVGRIQDENAAREAKYQDMLVQYGARMADIAEALVEIKNNISDLKNQH